MLCFNIHRRKSLLQKRRKSHLIRSILLHDFSPLLLLETSLRTVASKVPLRQEVLLPGLRK